MKRRNHTPAIAPFVDQWGNPAWTNPYGQYPPNPALTASREPSPVVQRIVLNTTAVAQPTVVAAPAAITAPVIASVTSEAPEVAVENTAAIIPAQSAPRLHLSLPTTGLVNSIDTTSPAYLAARARARKAMGLDTDETPVERTPNRAERDARIHRRIRRGVAVITAVGAGVVGITAASAMWSSHGTGAGKSKATTMQALTFGVATTSGTALLPGSTPGNVTTPGGTMSLNITNPNPFTVNITSVTQAGLVNVDGTHAALGCTSDTGTWGGSVVQGTGHVTVPTKSGLAVAVAPGTRTVTIPDSVQMATNSNTNCQGATFTAAVTITVSQQ
jgi:hypothetical protein